MGLIYDIVKMIIKTSFRNSKHNRNQYQEAKKHRSLRIFTLIEITFHVAATYRPCNVQYYILLLHPFIYTFVYSKQYCLWRGITIVDVAILMAMSLTCSDIIDKQDHLYSRSNGLYLVLPIWTLSSIHICTRGSSNSNTRQQMSTCHIKSM